MTLAALIDAWLTDRAAAGCRPQTLRVYRTRTSTLRRELGPRAAGDVARGEWLAWLARETLRPSGERKAPDTIRLILTVVRMLQEFALETEAITAPWLRPKDLKRPAGRQRERLPTESELRNLLSIAPADFALIFGALRSTGARPSELAAAHIEQLHTLSAGRRVLILREHKSSRKGKDRRIYIGQDAAPFFDTAIGGRTSGPIFLRASPRFRDSAVGWTAAAITTSFRTLRRRLGLPEDLKLYAATRHAFVTAVTRKSGIGLAKHLAGHASIATTQRYDHPSDEDLFRAQEGLYDAA